MHPYHVQHSKICDALLNPVAFLCSNYQIYDVEQQGRKVSWISIDSCSASLYPSTICDESTSRSRLI